MLILCSLLPPPPESHYQDVTSCFPLCWRRERFRTKGIEREERRGEETGGEERGGEEGKGGEERRVEERRGDGRLQLDALKRRGKDS